MLTALTFNCDMRSVRETGARCSPWIRTSGATDCSIDKMTGGGAAAKAGVAARHIVNKSIFMWAVSLLGHRHDARSKVALRLLFRHHRFDFIAQLPTVIDDTVLDDVVDTAHSFRALSLRVQADGARGI